MLLDDVWNGLFYGIFYDDVYGKIPGRVSLTGACSEEPSDLLCDRVKVNVVETGPCWQAGHSAHLRDTQQRHRKRTLLAGRMTGELFMTVKIKL